jgi:hypothetical protein
MRYEERLVPSAAWWALALGSGVVMGWIVWVASTAVAGLVALVVVALLGVALVARWTLRVRVDDDGTLHVGRAVLGPGDRGRATALDAAGYREVHGPRADHRAVLFTRPWARRGVRVEVTDPADPAPYWLVSSGRPFALADALDLGQTGPDPSGEDPRGTTQEEG